MKFLHLLSMEASHGITVHCLTEPLYNTAVTSSANRHIPIVRSHLRFRGWNRQIFETDTLLEPHVLQDGCKHTSPKWPNWPGLARLATLTLADLSTVRSKMAAGTTRYSASKNQDSRQLPITDIQELTSSQPPSQQHIEVGLVCFL
ncbi:unnamed protein product [Boreogadus saida]